MTEIRDLRVGQNVRRTSEPYDIVGGVVVSVTLDSATPWATVRYPDGMEWSGTEQAWTTMAPRTYHESHIPTGATRIMAERVRRATGHACTLENTGGGVMVARWDRADGMVVVMNEEGMSVWPSVAAWEGGDYDGVVGVDDAPFATVERVVATLGVAADTGTVVTDDDVEAWVMSEDVAGFTEDTRVETTAWGDYVQHTSIVKSEDGEHAYVITANAYGQRVAYRFRTTDGARAYFDAVTADYSDGE